MTISEYKQASARYINRSFVACVVPVGIAMICVAVYAPFEHRFENFLLTRFNSALAGVFVVLPMVIPTGVALLSLLPLARRILRESGIPCPHCRKPLAGYQAVVVASRNCPHCGKSVIGNDPQTA